MSGTSAPIKTKYFEKCIKYTKYKIFCMIRLEFKTTYGKLHLMEFFKITKKVGRKVGVDKRLISKIC